MWSKYLHSINKKPTRRVLRMTDVVLTVLRWMAVLMGVFFVVVFVLAIFAPEWMPFVTLTSHGKLNISVSGLMNFGVSGSNTSFLFEDLGLWTRMDILLRTMLGLVILYLLLLLFQGFIRSARTAESYFRNNAVLFRKMAFLFLGWAVVEMLPLCIITFPDDALVENSIRVQVSFPLVRLLFFMICSVFSEVFYEGEMLKEESDYTV